MFIIPYSISIPQERLDVLHHKLDLVTWPDELKDAGWDYGAPLSDLKRLTRRWRSGYDWRAQEHKINITLPQYTTNIDIDGWGSFNIHFVHKRSSRPNAIPLLFCHGWPGSFLEVAKILPLLTEPESDDNPAFHVVAGSYPGFAFSEGPTNIGFHVWQFAEVQHELMQRLGYTQYVTQGGDWGSETSRAIGLKYSPEHCKASHFNMLNAHAPSPWTTPLQWISSKLVPYSDHEKVGLERSKLMLSRGLGYYKQQATRPQTLGYSLADSPVGLLAWIYEKLCEWADDYPWSDDEILTWVSVYWFSRAGPAASVRIYYEYERDTSITYRRLPAHLPIGISYFPQEILYYPRSHSRAMGNVVFEGVHSKGGHFGAHEQPYSVAGDLFKMFGRLGPAYGVVDGADGY